MRRDLVYRDEIMDSLVKEYNRKRTNDGLKLAWIEKAVNDVKPAPIDVPDIYVGELISRQPAIDEGMSYINGDCFCDKEDFAKYIEFIEQLPPIQPVIGPCDYAKACNEVTMDKLTSAVAYYDVLEEFRKHGYVLVDMREVTT